MEGEASASASSSISGQKRKTTEEDKGEGEGEGDDQSNAIPLSPFSGWWDNFSQRLIFAGTLLGEEAGLASFESFMKLSRNTYNYICGMVEQEMIAKSDYTDLNNMTLSLNDRVAISLRWLSSGESMATLGELVGVHESTVSEITWCFVEAMEKKGQHHLFWPHTVERLKKIKSKFEKIAGLPNCCGAIETTKFMFCLASDYPSRIHWCDGENNPSMLLQAIVDPDMRFLYIVTGLPGCLGESGVLSNSPLFKSAEKGETLNGEKRMLSEYIGIREYILGDVEYHPPLAWLVTPNKGKKLSDDQQNFNGRHYATWKVAKQALIRLKERWRILQGISHRPDLYRLRRIIFVCCLLHNIIIDQNEGMQDEIDDLTTSHQQNTASASASAQRDKLSCTYFSS